MKYLTDFRKTVETGVDPCLINMVNTSLAPGVFKETIGISNLYIIYPDKTLHYTANFNVIPVL